ncbi:MAG: hypothetical protein OSA84_03700 [Akkermansiaceae bacterium]|nr:hypothetical protein [Akkermansiaceae bacterium]
MSLTKTTVNRRLANPRSLAWLLCLTLIAATCAAWSALPSLESSPLLRVALFAAMGTAMLGTVFLFPETTDRNARRLILLAAVLLRLVLWPAPVSDDVNRYLWEGQLVAAGENPYSAPADDPRWESRRDATWQAMNHRDRPTAYPPGIQWVMAASATISPSLKSFKALALLGDLATLLLLFRLMRENSAPLRWAGFYAFNPVILICFAAEAHFDSLMVAALLAAILAASREKKSVWIWIWLGIAIQIKLVCLILIPLFLIRKKKPRMHPAVKIFLFIAFLIVPGLPFLTALPGWIDGVRAFASESAFNAPIFTLLASTGLSLDAVKILCTTAFLSSAAAICISRWRGLHLIDSILWMLAALLACSPIVHFWYLAWLLPLTALRPSFAWTTLSITIAGYFIAWHTQETLGWWGYGHGIAAIIWIPWLIAAIAQHRFLLSKWLGRPATGRAGGVPPPDFALTIVIPALSPEPSLQALIQTLHQELPDNSEIIISTCDPNFPNQPNTRLITAPRGRGNQIAAGIAATEAPWILIAHADSTPRPGFAETLSSALASQPRASLIIFGQRFPTSTFRTLLIEALNEIRVVFGGVAFGDQTMVIRRSSLEAAGGFPAQPLMEDVEASMRLAARGDVIYLGREWYVSARKWEKSFATRFLLVIRLVATYQLARLRSSSHAAAVSERMYREYYPPSETEK